MLFNLREKNMYVETLNRFVSPKILSFLLINVEGSLGGEGTVHLVLTLRGGGKGRSTFIFLV